MISASLSENAMKILEIKRHLNKPDESYLCDLLKRGNGYALIRYVSPGAGRVGPLTFEAGTVTDAYYHTGGGYVQWRMRGPDGRLRGHLFHVCREQTVAAERVEYLDMLLDVWVDQNGELTFLDRDEVDMCAARGLLDEQDLAWIADQEHKIRDDNAKMIAAFDRLIGGL
jgi:hypothetical protein